MIRFTKHALEKFYILKRHGFYIPENVVIKTVADPEFIDYARAPLKIAQRNFNSERVLRVVYKESDGIKTIITFYPGRKTQYEKK